MKNLLKKLLMVLVCSLSAFANAQDVFKSIGFELSPSFNFPVVKNKKEMTSDSNITSYHSRLSLSGGINYSWEASSGIRFQIGLNYADNGHRYVVHDLRFLDTIHRGIGRKNDLSQTGDEHNVYSNVRYQYLELPFITHFKINSQRKIPNLSIFASLGVAPSFLLKHNEVIRLRGFSTQEGKNKFYINNTYFVPNQINFGVIAGARIAYKVASKFSVSFDPKFKAYILAANQDNEKHSLISIHTSVSLNYIL